MNTKLDDNKWDREDQFKKKKVNRGERKDDRDLVILK